MGDAERESNLLDDVLEPEAGFYQDTNRADLFGAESDDEEGAIFAETQQLDATGTQAFDDRVFEEQPFETQVADDAFDTQIGNQSQEAPAETATQALGSQEGVQPEEANVGDEPELADYQETQAVDEGANDARGELDDIFASDSEDEAAPVARQESEAEDEDEEDEFEAMFKTGKKRKRQGRTAEMLETVEALIANMEVAAEMDISANENGKPAVEKIKQLALVEDKLSQKQLHRELLDGGILGAMKLWIELMPDGSLPNVKVRTAVFKMLHKLPIDLTLEGRKEQLAKSQLGKFIMFYSKLPDEILTNRQLARGLVEKWSRPIFEQYRESAQDDELQERERELTEVRKRRNKEVEATQPNPIAYKNLKPGDPGFRWHASIPAPAKLDYMRRPDSQAATEGEAVKGKAKPKDKMSKKLVAMSKKGGRKSAAEGKVSLQGRGLLL